jgi:hypothetical protein
VQPLRINVSILLRYWHGSWPYILITRFRRPRSTPRSGPYYLCSAFRSSPKPSFTISQRPSDICAVCRSSAHYTPSPRRGSRSKALGRSICRPLPNRQPLGRGPQWHHEVLDARGIDCTRPHMQDTIQDSLVNAWKSRPVGVWT